MHQKQTLQTQICNPTDPPTLILARFFPWSCPFGLLGTRETLGLLPQPKHSICLSPNWFPGLFLRFSLGPSSTCTRFSLVHKQKKIFSFKSFLGHASPNFRHLFTGTTATDRRASGKDQITCPGSHHVPASFLAAGILTALGESLVSLYLKQASPGEPS